MTYRRALHFAGYRAESFGDIFLLLRAVDEAVARGNFALDASDAADSIGSGADFIGKLAVGGDINYIYARYHSDRVAERTRVHVVLDNEVADRDITDIELRAQASGNARVYYPLRRIEQDHRLGAHRREHFAYSTDGGHYFAPAKRAARELDAADCLCLPVLHLRVERLYFDFHRSDYSGHGCLLFIPWDI